MNQYKSNKHYPVALWVVLILMVVFALPFLIPKGHVKQEIRQSYIDKGVYLYTYVYYEGQHVNMVRDITPVSDSIKKLRKEEAILILKEYRNGNRD